jgi:predicted ester cyclase
MTDDEITDLGRHPGIEELLQPAGERRQSMRGFDPEFVDIVDYIVRITHRIWEEKGVGRLYDYYAHNVVIHTSDGDIYGREAVIAATLQTLAAYPERRLFAEDVIWGGDDEQGFYTSHRLVHMGYNTGHSLYGPPTGRLVRYTAIADCLVLENRIVEEWLVRDELCLIRQLGLDPVEMARTLVEKKVEQGYHRPTVVQIERLQGQDRPAAPPSPDDYPPVEAWVRRNLHTIWNWRLLDHVDNIYAPNCVVHVPGGITLYGRDSLKTWLLRFMAAFPDVAVSVDHVCWVGMDAGKHRVAIRWTLGGTHTGPGEYGPPSGKPVSLLVVSHQNVAGGRIVQEWLMFDAFSLLKQLAWPVDL